MSITQLQWESTHEFAFPVSSGNPPNMVATALTVCELSGDPALAFLTQGGGSDEVAYLSLADGDEYTRHVTPAGRDTISGMGYNPFTKHIWCSYRTNTPDLLTAFDPLTGLETGIRNLAPDPHMSLPDGLACNGLFFARSNSQWIELRTMTGFKLGEREYAGRSIRGVSASPWSYTFVDKNNDELVVIGPYGNEIAVSNLPGTASGVEAVAFDNIVDHAHAPQVWLDDGKIGDVNTIHHPDTPWNPVPWGGRHRIYVANNLDQMIYAGYLTV
ncbi:MAG: hypothetical protein AAF402_00675 [Pseudomonadota bacterium]